MEIQAIAGRLAEKKGLYIVDKAYIKTLEVNTAQGLFFEDITAPA